MVERWTLPRVGELIERGFAVRLAVSSVWRILRRGALRRYCPLLARIVFLGMILNTRAALAQTPSPLQEWQYTGGVILARLFEPDLPKFRTVLGLASEVQPIYSGAAAYRVEGGPVINIFYRDVAFISTGGGIGYNVLGGDHYQLGVAMAYDLRRKVKKITPICTVWGTSAPRPLRKSLAQWCFPRSFR